MNRSLTFNNHDYRHLYRQLKTMDDVERLSSHYPEDLLFIIYHQNLLLIHVYPLKLRSF